MLPRILIAIALGCASLASHGAPLHLREIGATRFVEPKAGEVWLQRGLLTALGDFRVTDQSPVLVSVVVPPEALNRTLIQLEAWSAYQRLGQEALVNFVTPDDGPIYTVGLRQYLTVSPSPEPRLGEGVLVNISTRGQASTGSKLVAGFVVDEQHRWVLIRAIGPGLASYGVADFMADPYLTLFKGHMPIGYNDDWSKRPDATDIATATGRVGAFPLSTGSKDAALLVQLTPGAYTVQAEPESGSAGTVLLEVYTLPAFD